MFLPARAVQARQVNSSNCGTMHAARKSALRRPCSPSSIGEHDAGRACRPPDGSEIRADHTLAGNLTSELYKLTGEAGSYRYMAPEVFRHEPYNSKVQVLCNLAIHKHSFNS